METLLEILKYTVPSIVMMVGVVVMMNRLFRQEGERRMFEMRRLNVNVIVPAKMRAYERLTLFLERITPESMFGRFDISGLTNIQLQQMLIRAVRDEFEHNVSQQIYVSSEAWVFVRNAREFMVQFINSCAVQCEPDGDSMQLAKMLLEGYASMENAPVQLALVRLHQEFKMF